MLLDFKIDTSSRKLTLCRILKTEKNALGLLFFLVFFAYINIINIIKMKNYNLIYILPIFSIPSAYILIREMSKHIKNKEEITKEEFLKKFLLPQKLLVTFSILLGIALILDKII